MNKRSYWHIFFGPYLAAAFFPLLVFANEAFAIGLWGWFALLWRAVRRAAFPGHPLWRQAPAARAGADSAVRRRRLLPQRPARDWGMAFCAHRWQWDSFTPLACRA